MADILCDVVVGSTRLRSTPLAMLAMKIELHGFQLLYIYVALSIPIVIGLRFADLRATRAPLLLAPSTKLNKSIAYNQLPKQGTNLVSIS